VLIKQRGVEQFGSSLGS